jgi:hypothetical protein
MFFYGMQRAARDMKPRVQNIFAKHFESPGQTDMADNEAALAAFLGAYGETARDCLIGETASIVIVRELTAEAARRERLFGKEASDAAAKLRFAAARFKANPGLVRSLPVFTPPPRCLCGGDPLSPHPRG